MPDPTQLHDLTAELHAAVNSPQRWRAAWLALNEFLGQADQPSEGSPLSPALGSNMPGGSGPGTERRHSAGYSALRRSDPAEAPVGAGAGGGLHDLRCDLQATYLAALDALPLAAWFCNENRHILHASAAGLAELKRQRWFKLEGDQLCASDHSLQQRLVAGFADLAARGTHGGSLAQATVQLEGGALEVGLRRVEQTDRSLFVLVSVATGVNHDMAVPQDDKMAYWPERRLLSPRQRELAGLLLTFHSLDAAADKMGITRRTARDHLAALFQATGMRRQQDLINFLRRGTLS
ncbi:MAG TPA: hypothetical protein VFX90_02195 [Rhodoferax sp.]|nr:hypothetical protein [Rhodoferax sp.]